MERKGAINIEDRRFVVDSGASTHMMSKEDLCSDEMDTLRRSRNPTMVGPQMDKCKRIAERAVRRVKEGTSAVLLQSGLDDKWWSDSMECCCYLRNVQDLLADGKKPV